MAAGQFKTSSSEAAVICIIIIMISYGSDILSNTRRDRSLLSRSGSNYDEPASCGIAAGGDVPYRYV